MLSENIKVSEVSDILRKQLEGSLPVRLCGVALDVLTPGGQALDFAAYQGFYRPIFGRLAPLFVQKRQ